MPRTKPASQRRADLLDAAQSVFVDKGVTAATLDDITQRAGVAKGTFYLYFRSKDEVVRALQNRFGDQFADRIATAVARQTEWGAKLDALVGACYADFAAQLELHDMLFHYAGYTARPDSEDGPSISRTIAVFRDLLADGTAAGAYHVEDAELTATLLYSAIHGAFEATHHGATVPPEHRLIEATRHMVHRAAGSTTSPS